MLEKEDEVTEVEITLDPTLEDQYQQWIGYMKYDERHAILKKTVRPQIRSDDLLLRLEFLSRRGEVSRHIVEKALVGHFTDVFSLPSKKLAHVILENKRKEIKKELGSYYDHTGIKKSLDKALILNWKDVTKHWNKLHKMLSSGIEQLRVGASLEDVTKPISKKTSEFFSDDYDAHNATLVVRLHNLRKEGSHDFQKCIDFMDDLKIAGNIASKVEELAIEYGASVKGFSL